MELWHWHLMAFYPGWTSKWYSMEFQGTLESSNKKITEFHGIPWNYEGAVTNDTGVPWNSMEYSMEFHGTLVPPNDISLSSIEFHGTFHGIPWNSGAAKWHITLFHGIPWNIPWNSMELWCRQMKYHLVLWNSMEHSMEFHGTLVPPNDISLSSMEFHGTLTLTFYGILPWLDFQVIFNGIPGNSGVVK